MQLTIRMPDEYRVKIEMIAEKHLLGTTESGIKDLGKRHREHLVGKIRKVM